jgi:hypothetical protein
MVAGAQVNPVPPLVLFSCICQTMDAERKARVRPTYTVKFQFNLFCSDSCAQYLIIVETIVPDPDLDPDPSDTYVFGPPGSGSGSGSISQM